MVAEVRQAVRGGGVTASGGVGGASGGFLSGTRPAHLDYSNQPAVQQLQQEIQNVAFGRQQQLQMMAQMLQEQQKAGQQQQGQGQGQGGPQGPQGPGPQGQ